MTAVGRLTHQKGFDLLIQAFSSIAAKHPDWKLVIWGDGDERGKLEAQRDALGLAARVEMPGLTSRPGEWIETADAFVLSSRFEGWGIALLEAMAAGLPVVAFDCEWGPGAMVTNGSDGILVPRNDVDALGEALDLVLSDSNLRAKLASNAQATAQKYRPDRILQNWDAVVSAAVLRGKQALSGLRVARELDGIIEERGKPRMIVSDNGSEFTSDAILQ